MSCKQVVSSCESEKYFSMMPALDSESTYRLLVLHLLRDDEATGKGIETAGRAAMLLGGLGEEQITSVLQVRTLVEVSLEGTR